MYRPRPGLTLSLSWEVRINTKLTWKHHVSAKARAYIVLILGGENQYQTYMETPCKARAYSVALKQKIDGRRNVSGRPPYNEGSDGTYKVAAAITQFAGAWQHKVLRYLSCRVRQP